MKPLISFVIFGDSDIGKPGVSQEPGVLSMPNPTLHILRDFSKSVHVFCYKDVNMVQEKDVSILHETEKNDHADNTISRC